MTRLNTRKPGITARSRKARATRDQRYAAKIRVKVADRDGFCRFGKDAVRVCQGNSEWAHLGEKKRARTRGMPPEERHTTSGSLMLCTFHHQQYDAGRLHIIGDADAELTYERA